MSVSVLVERHSFFPSPDGGHLRWTETSPEDVHRHHHDCGCTVTAETRPPGDPESVQQSVTLAGDDASLSLGTGWLTFGEMGGEHHRYFRFHPTERSVQIEITLPGHGLADCFFAHLYFGSSVDTSRLLNGHSPTMLNLSNVEGAHWLHLCSWGKEGIRYLVDRSEVDLWDSAYALHELVRSLSAPYVVDVSSAVGVLRGGVTADSRLLSAFSDLRSLLAPIAADVRPTELFRLASDLEREVYGL